MSEALDVNIVWAWQAYSQYSHWEKVENSGITNGKH